MVSILRQIQREPVPKKRKLFLDLLANWRDHDACIEWPGARTNAGYGKLLIDKVLYQTHVLSYMLSHEDYDPSLNVLHTCDNPPCFHPGHLFQGTLSDNTQDCFRKGRFVVPFRKLTAEQVRQIREIGSSKTKTQIGEEFGVSRRVIREILEGRYWKNV